MPALRIQFGEVADRLRRSLGLRGPIPTELDTHVSPVVVLSQPDEPPYALDPQWGAGNQDCTGAAGVQATIAVINDGPEGSCFIVDQLTIAAGATGQRVEISRSGILGTDVAIADTNQMADTTSQARPGATGRDLPVRILSYTAGTLTTVGSICEIVAAPSLTTLGSMVLPVKHMLRRGEVLYAKHMNTAQRLILGVSGRYFANVGDTGA